MNNDDVLLKLNESINKLKETVDVLVNIRTDIGTATRHMRQQRRKLTSLISKMIAERSSLESIVREREATDEGSFPSLADSKSAEFLFQMNILNMVIMADQGFDQIVAIANGIRAASEEIEDITG